MIDHDYIFWILTDIVYLEMTPARWYIENGKVIKQHPKSSWKLRFPN